MNRRREKVINDIRKLNLRNWRKHVKDGKAGNNLVQKTHDKCTVVVSE